MIDLTVRSKLDFFLTSREMVTSRRYFALYAVVLVSLGWCVLETCGKDFRQTSYQRTKSYKSTSQRINNVDSHATCCNAYNNLTSNELARLIDASGKPGSGIFEGNTLWFGSFGECKKQRDARYCLTSFAGAIVLAENKSQVEFFQWGVCMPRSCDREFLIGRLEFFLNNVRPLNNSINAECAEDPEYTAGVILTIVFFGLWLGVCFLATLLEILHDVCKRDEGSIHENSNHISMDKEPNEKTPLVTETTTPQGKVKSLKASYSYQIINCFPVTRNVKFIMTTKVGKTDLTYLHGIRVLSMFWIIYLHVSTAFINLPVAENFKDVRRFLRRETSIFFMNAMFAVDTFFLLSGLLVIYTNLNKREKRNGKTNWFMFYLHRFLRLTPSYMLAILFVTKLRPFFGDGPIWYIARDTSACSHHWWTNLLYINNFKSVDEGCIPQTWYLAADMQFFVISPILIIIALRYGFRRLVIVSSVLILASVITTASIIGAGDRNPNLIKDIRSPPEAFKEDSDYFKDVYVKPYCRLSPYVVGLVLGYIVFRYFLKTFHLAWYAVIAMWITALSVQFAVLYAPYSAVRVEDPRQWTKAENVAYGSLRRPAWSLSVAWVIFACHYGYAGIIKDILAAKFWIPLSRINYAAFILHIDVIMTILVNIESPLHFTGFTQVVYFLAILVLSYVCAFIFTLVVELPCTNLERLLNSRATREI